VLTASTAETRWFLHCYPCQSTQSERAEGWSSQIRTIPPSQCTLGNLWCLTVSWTLSGCRRRPLYYSAAPRTPMMASHARDTSCDSWSKSAVTFQVTGQYCIYLWSWTSFHYFPSPCLPCPIPLRELRVDARIVAACDRRTLCTESSTSCLRFRPSRVSVH
jgi:hypothetical protein